ncbi:MAG: hypothetical protein B6I19_09680 [Bacteroidetes bacterium 4572_114]|nr:MAG: hypothetical protein B6I19_09680 [Bacteroidetes bacterium 4572_114]
MKRQTPNTIKLKSAGKLIIMLLVIALFTIVPFSLRADDPPPPPPMEHGSNGNQPPGGGAPVGGGLLILTMLGVGYGWLKIRIGEKKPDEV